MMDSQTKWSMVQYKPNISRDISKPVCHAAYTICWSIEQIYVERL